MKVYKCDLCMTVTKENYHHFGGNTYLVNGIIKTLPDLYIQASRIDTDLCRDCVILVVAGKKYD